MTTTPELDFLVKKHVQHVAEFGRTTPDDQPDDMLLITCDELAELLRDFAEELREAKAASGTSQSVKETTPVDMAIVSEVRQLLVVLQQNHTVTDSDIGAAVEVARRLHNATGSRVTNNAALIAPVIAAARTA